MTKSARQARKKRMAQEHYKEGRAHVVVNRWIR